MQMDAGEQGQAADTHCTGSWGVPLKAVFLIALYSLPRGTSPGPAVRAGRRWCQGRVSDRQRLEKKQGPGGGYLSSHSLVLTLVLPVFLVSILTC